jgi:HSP20 family protein
MFSSFGFEDNLMDDFKRLQREMEEVFGSGYWPAGIRTVARGTYPPVNIGSTPNQVDVYLFVAGIDTKTLEITLQQNLLTIAGERRLISEAGANYYRKERYDGEFRRVLTLPDDVDQDKVVANYHDGVLHITVQRRETAKPRQIEIK